MIRSRAYTVARGAIAPMIGYRSRHTFNFALSHAKRNVPNSITFIFYNFPDSDNDELQLKLDKIAPETAKISLSGVNK